MKAPGAMDLGASGHPKWREAVVGVINSRSKDAKRCVTDLIDYTMNSCVALYAGTVMEDRWMVYGDALSAWYEKEAQEHLAKKYPLLKDRIIVPVGTSRVGTTAKRGGPPGNSPVNARATESFGFADLEYSMNFNHALACVYPYGDARRIFGQGTPNEVWHLMNECWIHCAPAPERIKEDILGWKGVAQQIVDAKGAMVPDLDFRSGRRLLRIDNKTGPNGSNMRKTKAKKRDRKDTVAQELTYHPQLKGAVDVLLGGV